MSQVQTSETLILEITSSGKVGLGALFRTMFTAGSGLPTSFALGNARPNPSSGTTVIPFALPEDVYVQFEVYDIAGRKVATLPDGRLRAGEHTRKVADLPPGNYIYQLKAVGFTSLRKLFVVAK